MARFILCYLSFLGHLAFWNDMLGRQTDSKTLFRRDVCTSTHSSISPARNSGTATSWYDLRVLNLRRYIVVYSPCIYLRLLVCLNITVAVQDPPIICAGKSRRHELAGYEVATTSDTSLASVSEYNTHSFDSEAHRSLCPWAFERTRMYTCEGFPARCHLYPQHQAVTQETTRLRLWMLFVSTLAVLLPSFMSTLVSERWHRA
ncbi:hypothetical protein GY45DRAFT_354038 [Cubamyces sp. BRFM 1775]|nr:hypothetical protein GY45DRAFT_354038 [Cubamyces sp. BRFM 1775]